jgi:hypothetical protein
MSLVTITEAATLVNKSTQTLYRHIKTGKLSRESSGLIQTAELIRVYGELKPIEKSQKQPSHNTLQSVSSDIVTLLQQQINKLEQDLRELKSEGLERERQAIDRERRLMALLENQATTQTSIKPENNIGGLFSKLFK